MVYSLLRHPGIVFDLRVRQARKSVINVLTNLSQWKNTTPDGNIPFDYRLEDSTGQVKVQVKMQRQKNHMPMTAKQAGGHLPEDCWVVETQRTRGGTKNGEETRPYRFGEFDILAVSMHPSCKDWSSFMYTVANWLLPRKDNPTLIQKFQPVSKIPNEVWTDDFETAVQWYRSGQTRSLNYCIENKPGGKLSEQISLGFKRPSS